MKIKIYSVLLVTVFSASADMPSSVGIACNRVTGSLTHAARNLLFNIGHAPIKPENEEEVRSIAEKMDITPQELIICSYPPTYKGDGPHGAGNRIYFDDEWFDEWKDAPHVRQFVIGHELAHLKKYHASKKLMFSLLTTGVLVYPFCRAGYSFYKYFFPTPGKNDTVAALRSGLTNLGIYGLLRIVCPIAHSTLSQKYEYEADAYTLEQLGPIYGKRLIAQGAGEYFSKSASFKPYTFIEKYLESHPCPKNRLKMLAMPEDVSKEAGEKMLKLYKKRVILCLCALFGEGDVVLFSQNWAAICSAARLCSAYDSAADAFGKKLERISDLFSALVESIKKGSLNYVVLEKDFAREDIDRLARLIHTSTRRDARLNGAMSPLKEEIGIVLKILQEPNN